MKKYPLIFRLEKSLKQALAAVLLVVLAVVVFLHTEMAEGPIRHAIERKIQEICDVKVSIDKVNLQLPYTLIAEGVYVEAKDGYKFFVGNVSVTGSLLQLYFSSSPKVEVNIKGMSIAPEGVRADLVFRDRSQVDVEDFGVKGLDYSAMANFTVDLKKMYALFSKCHIRAYGQELLLQKPLAISFLDNRISVAQGHLTCNGSDLFVDCKNVGKELAFSARWDKLPLLPLGEAMEFPLISGESSGVGTIQLFGEKVHGHFETSISNIVLAHEALPVLNAKLSGDIHGEKLLLHTKVYDGENQLIEADARAFLKYAANFPIGLDYEAPFQSEASLDVEIAPYCDPFVSNKLFLAGKVSSHFHVSGTLASPKLSGDGLLKNGYFESVAIGALFSPIEADLNFDGSTIIVSNLKGMDARKGAVSGFATISLEENVPFSLSLIGNRAAVVSLDSMEGLFSGNVIFSGDRSGARLSGSLIANSVEVFLPEEKTESVQSVDVIYVNQDDEEIPPTQQKMGSTSWPVITDLSIKSANTVSIHGNGVSSTWKGELKISDYIDNPSVAGECHLVSGESFFNGKKWKIKEGTVSFSGDSSKRATLYVVAELDVGDVLVEIIIKGPYNDLSIAFRSSPSLSQREILSLILFGRELGEITPFQGAELSRSINKLKEAVASESNILIEITKKLNFLDRVNIVRSVTEEGEEDVSLHVGKYILPRLFLGGKISKKTNSIGIEANIMENVKLQAELADDKDKQIHLKWKRDY